MRVSSSKHWNLIGLLWALGAGGKVNDGKVQWQRSTWNQILLGIRPPELVCVNTTPHGGGPTSIFT